MKFYVCKHCGNIITFVENKNVPVVCCGEKMTEIVAGSVDAAVEKHVPVVEIKGNKVDVNVGSVSHPMLEEHHIAWVAVETDKGYQIKYLNKTGEPKVSFELSEGESVKDVYAYCNLHGLWKK